MKADLIRQISEHQDDVYRWLEHTESQDDLPLYTSVDIRDAGFKMSVVDTNLFPAGFNNICGVSEDETAQILKNAILGRIPACQSILLVCEQHTRNKWYLENVLVLANIIMRAGFAVKVATELEGGADQASLETASGKQLTVYQLQSILESQGQPDFDLIILNNDLTTGAPDLLRQTQVPVLPVLNAGWHCRSKSGHFQKANGVIKEFSEIIGVDPWVLSTYFTSIEDVAIQNDDDRQKMADLASDLLAKIKEKYMEYGISEKPFIFLKSDSGTYGMGVISIDDANQIIDLNRKGRNKLYKGKSAQIIDKFILQEGVPSVIQLGGQTSEVCIYQIDNQFVGGFYRVNSQKSDRENLNSQGMSFQKMCLTGQTDPCITPPDMPTDSAFDQCGVPTTLNDLELYRILARLSGIAAQREMVDLKVKDCG